MKRNATTAVLPEVETQPEAQSQDQAQPQKKAKKAKKEKKEKQKQVQVAATAIMTSLPCDNETSDDEKETGDGDQQVDQDQVKEDKEDKETSPSPTSPKSFDKFLELVKKSSNYTQCKEFNIVTLHMLLNQTSIGKKLAAKLQNELVSCQVCDPKVAHQRWFTLFVALLSDDEEIAALKKYVKVKPSASLELPTTPSDVAKMILKDDLILIEKMRKDKDNQSWFKASKVRSKTPKAKSKSKKGGKKDKDTTTAEGKDVLVKKKKKIIKSEFSIMKDKLSKSLGGSGLMNFLSASDHLRSWVKSRLNIRTDDNDSSEDTEDDESKEDDSKNSKSMKSNMKKKYFESVSWYKENYLSECLAGRIDGYKGYREAFIQIQNEMITLSDKVV